MNDRSASRDVIERRHHNTTISASQNGLEKPYEEDVHNNCRNRTGSQLTAFIHNVIISFKTNKDYPVSTTVSLSARELNIQRMSPRSTTTTTGLSSFSGGRNDERTVLGSSAANCHIASTAGADTWKTWAGRKHGSDDSFEVLDLFRGMKRSLHNRFFVSPPPPGTVCPICFTEPNDNASEWHITWCNHAVCLDCLRGYASSQIRDRDQMGPLKCPVCPKALRRRDAIVSLAHDEELIRQWDVKLRNQLLRALPSYRHCPKCSDRGDGPGGGGGGGGFVTPQCLAPHYEERRKDATTLLKDGRAAARFLIGCQYLFVVWLIAKTPSRSPTLDLFFMMVPIYIFFKMALGVDGVLARAAREKLRRPITVVCPCCNEDFILPADKKYSEEEETSRWINANTRPCPSCSVPISKNVSTVLADDFLML